MEQIIAFWVHPRSISTGFERVFIERGDYKVLHEPFSPLYYVYEKRVDVPGQHIDPGVPHSYADIRQWILEEGDKAAVFFKDMAYHPFDHIIKDDEFLQRLTHTFLIREPEKTILSHAVMNPDVTRDEIGYELEFKLFEKVAEVTGKKPVLIDADELEDDPEGITRAYCEAISIPFIEASLSWNPGQVPEWDSWKEWHVDAAESCGIQKNMETFDFGLDDRPNLRDHYEYHLPFYEKLYQDRVTK